MTTVLPTNDLELKALIKQFNQYKEECKTPFGWISHSGGLALCATALKLGFYFLGKENFQTAYDYFAEALEVFSRGLVNEDLLNYMIEGISYTYVQGNIYKRRNPLCTRIEDLFSSNKGKLREVEAILYTFILRLSNEYLMVNGLDIVEATLELGYRAIQIWTELNDIYNLATAQRLTGILLDQYKRGDGIDLVLESSRNLEKMLAGNYSPPEKLVVKLSLVEVYECLGHQYFNVGLVEQALDNYQKFRRYLLETDSPRLIDSYLSIANTYIQMSKTDEAILEFKDAILVAQQSKDYQSLAQIHRGLQIIYSGLNQNNKAEEELRLTKEALLKCEDGAGVFTMWQTLAELYKERSSWNDAIYCYKKVQLISHNVDNPHYELEAEYQLGLIYYHLRQWKESKKHFEIASRFANEDDPQGYKNVIIRYLNYLRQY